jgi:hypothetical protein
MEEVFQTTIEKQVENIIGFKNLIDKDPTNDFFLYPFMSMVLNLTDSRGFLTELGLSMLFNDITEDFNVIKEKQKDTPQENILRLALYFTVCFNLNIYFGGFILGLDTEEGKKYAEKLPEELLTYLKEIMERADKLHPVVEYQLKALLHQLTDDNAKAYNEEKRKHWTKDIFQTSVHIPAHPDDLPEGYKQENSINIP